MNIDVYKLIQIFICKFRIFFIIIFNRFKYVVNQFIKNRYLVHVDPTLMLGSYGVSLQASIGHKGFSVYCGHHTISVHCCEKTCYCSDDKITVCDIYHNRVSYTTYIMIYNLPVQWVYITITLRMEMFIPLERLWCQFSYLFIIILPILMEELNLHGLLNTPFI